MSIFKQQEQVALVDLDGTLVNYHEAINIGLTKLASPYEKQYTIEYKDFYRTLKIV
jgi:FMN phosphatase YigB (HAD superfamily)